MAFLSRAVQSSGNLWVSYMKALSRTLDFSYEESLVLTDEGRIILDRAKCRNLQAIRDLGCQYIWGEKGFLKDETRARYWYTVAADAGSTEAMWDVATMYLCGEGGDVDTERGLEYLRTAATGRRWAFGAELAAQLLVEIYQNGYYTTSDIAEAQKWQNIAKIQHRRYRGWKRKRAN